mmetsp:Transcript_3009/g.3624  ORF Transcript_3009/g.3624 Transcript_3009/m.3624 type:complete len:285 (+) Transcript_3009:1-855(+)
MTRKSKQAGGHQPLTHYERTKKFKSSAYGTTRARLHTDSQQPFGDCPLSLQPIEGPALATPSGHLYSKEALLQYVLQKTQDLKLQQKHYERLQQKQDQQLLEQQQQQTHQEIQQFEQSQRATQAGLVATKSQETKEPSKSDILKKTSYWMAQVAPDHQDPKNDHLQSPPPSRPVSPHSGQPLRRKEFIEITMLERQKDTQKVVCALSHKPITTQPVVLIHPKSKSNQNYIVLQDMFDQLIKPTMICPLTDTKLKPKHVLKLQKGKTGFASSGTVVASQYKPTMT